METVLYEDCTEEQKGRVQEVFLAFEKAVHKRVEEAHASSKYKPDEMVPVDEYLAEILGGVTMDSEDRLLESDEDRIEVVINEDGTSCMIPRNPPESN